MLWPRVPSSVCLDSSLFESEGQRVRTVSEVPSDGLGNCLDLSVVLVALPSAEPWGTVRSLRCCKNGVCSHWPGCVAVMHPPNQPRGSGSLMAVPVLCWCASAGLSKLIPRKTRLRRAQAFPAPYIPAVPEKFSVQRKRSRHSNISSTRCEGWQGPAWWRQSGPEGPPRCLVSPSSVPHAGRPGR